MKLNNILQMIEQAEVEWKTLGEVAEIENNARKPVKSSLRIAGDTPYYGANNIQGYVEGYTHNGEYILIAEDGSASLENYSIQFTSGRFWANNHVHVICGKYELNNRFLYHYLSQFNFTPYLSGGDRAKLTKAKLIQIPIPVIAMSIQKEIVNMLDKLTELKAELSLREKQYRYYRDHLLTFGDEVEWKSLGEVGELIRGNGLQKKDFTEMGVPAIHYGQIYTYYDTFANKTKSFVSAELAKKLKKAQYGDVLIAGTSENVEDVMKPLGWLGDEIVFSGDMFAFRPQNEIDTKYLTYLLQTTSFQKFKERYAQGTKVIRIKSDNFLQYSIPIPPLATQQKIVAILDKFERLTHSITEGLPKEIELREKQYQYYRDKLLSFSKV